MSQTNENISDFTKKQSTDSDTDANTEIDPSDKWLIRDCEVYEDEYDECTSFRGRFHQYFIYGESIDCNQWKKDYDNCCKWTSKNDIKAAEALIKSEKARRLERLRGHMRNNIWKKREAPPSDWDKPLPEWMVKRDENTYLAQKAQEIREGKPVEEKSSSCSIM